MRTSSKGIELIKSFEGLRLNAYKCSAGKLTIGYGHTGLVRGKKIKPDTVISETEANALLIEDLKKFEKRVNKYDIKYNWSQREFDAMVSFAFNIGSIDKLAALGTRSKLTIANKMLLYNKVNGKTTPGIVHRREIERLYFLK